MTQETTKRAYIHTWGCQMNEHKSEGIAGVLTEEGYELIDSMDEADVVVYNTCMVREKAVDKLLSHTGLVAKLKKKRPEVLLGIGGCVAQALKGELSERTNQTVDFIFGSSQIGEVPRLIREAKMRTNQRAVMAMERIPDKLEDLPFLSFSPFQGKITITEGCSNFCSFCIVPYTTGLLRSRLPGSILSEAAQFVEKKFQEVQLLGQNVDSYGNDLKDSDINFANLLKAFTEIDLPRVRFISSHPQDMTDDVVKVMGEDNNICEHIHVAVQSGSDRMLENMRRGYTKERFLSLMRDMKENVEEVSVTTDVIVGYPGETEEDFEQTVDLMQQARFDGAFIFKYSPRPGTISYLKYEDDVPFETKQARLEKLLVMQKQISEEQNEATIGKTYEVLVEKMARDQVRLLGKTRPNKTVLFPGNPSLIGKLVNVKINDADMGGLYGEVIV